MEYWLLFMVLLLLHHATGIVVKHDFNKHPHHQHGSGCFDKTTEGLQSERHPKMAACAGTWEGHIRNASSLCAEGWRVCGWYDQHLLKTINWKDATTMPGCFAFDAAQDGGQCRACRDDLEQDDLAGVGRGCPHQNIGQKSCISGGKIDVSCCVDSHLERPCTYRPDIATGVLCCKLPGTAPKIVIQPQAETHLLTEVTFILSCQATGFPPPVVFWYRDGELLPSNISRISVLDSGYLLVSQAKRTDSGLYKCLMVNSEGSDSATASVVVTDYESGCDDDTTDGLHNLEEIHACRGKWTGHVKRGRDLCARGWHVCSPKHEDLIKQITWDDIESLDGCYAYNTENTNDRCFLRCHTRNMAGVGRDCGRLRRSASTCLAEGRVDVYRSKTTGCTYQDGVTSGVLCCKRRSSRSVIRKPAICSPTCQHGGRCIENNRCQCPPGYKGAWCQHAACKQKCVPNAFCIRPNVCKCRPGFTGEKCRPKKHRCKLPCYNGGRCTKHNRCKCPITHTGKSCQTVVRWKAMLELNRTER